MSPDEARAQFKAIVDSCVGLAAEGGTLGEYDQAIITSGLDLVDPAKRHDMDRMSSCLLFSREVMRRAGIRSPILDAPYRVGDAGDDVVNLARLAGALRGPTFRPGVGDCVIIDRPTHAFWVSAISADGGTWTTVQGGERLADGAECIRAIDRPYVAGLHGAAFSNRPVLWVIDCVALAANEADW